MKPLLLGMNNPLSDEPEYDLYPYPPGCAGWRLWRMLPDGTTRQQYLDAFDRRNLLRAREWDQRAAREAADELFPKLSGRLVVVLGTQVRAALMLPPSEPLGRHSIVHERGQFEWIAFPHPSGRNHWFNDPANRAMASKVLLDLMRGQECRRAS